MISKIEDETSKLSQTSAQNHEELLKSRNSIDRLAQLSVKMETVERVVYSIKADIEGRDYKDHLTALQQTVRDHHSSLMMHLPQTMGHSKPSPLLLCSDRWWGYHLNRYTLTPHAVVTSATPRMSVIIFLLLVSQVILFGGYILYKRRQKKQPKKYL
jgi:mannose-binding lectin 1